MQLRTTPAERECKEKMNRKIKGRGKGKWYRSLLACITKILYCGALQHDLYTTFV
jgi:hypothetical protein